MKYKTAYSDVAEKQLKKLDKSDARRIVNRFEKNIDGSENPRQYGKALTGNYSGKWRFHVGNYRIICKIIDNKCEVLAISVGHRKNIYN